MLILHEILYMKTLDIVNNYFYWSVNKLSKEGFPGGSDGKPSAWNARDPGSIPELGRSLGERNPTDSSILAWRIRWTEEPGGYSPWSCKVFDMTEQLTLIGKLLFTFTIGIVQILSSSNELVF